MSEDQQGTRFYSNREIYEMLLDLRTEVIPLREEMRHTTESIRKYNGLRDRLDATERKLAEHLMTGAGQASVARGIREWGGWIVAIISLLIALTR